MFGFKTEGHRRIEKLSSDIQDLAGKIHFDVQEDYGGKASDVAFKLSEDWEPFDSPSIVKTGEAWHRRSEWVSKMHTDLEILEVKCKKGFKMKRHAHDDHIEICVVIKGAISYPMQNRHLVAGNSIEIPMDTKHTFEAEQDSFCLLIFKPKFN